MQTRIHAATRSSSAEEPILLSQLQPRPFGPIAEAVSMTNQHPHRGGSGFDLSNIPVLSPETGAIAKPSTPIQTKLNSDDRQDRSPFHLTVPPISALPSGFAPLQRYHVSRGARMSDDGQMGVVKESSVGGKTAYATPSLIQDASKQLKAATSVIALKPGALKEKMTALDGTEHDVVDIVPVNTKNKTEDVDMELWADCGRSARTVTGIDGGTGQGNATPVAQYHKGSDTKEGDAKDWMDIQKVKMFVDLFSTENPWWKIWKPKYESKLDLRTIKAKLVEYNTLKGQWIAEKDDAKKSDLLRNMSLKAKELDELSRVEYEKLGPDAKDDFDKQAGINMYADPKIGEAFHISTGGGEHPGKPADVGTWNFHWAGVVMKSSSDTMTLENYSVSDYNVENQDWVFQLYGVGKKGQSFHEEHRDVHKQHGDAPTSMVAVRP